MSEAITNDLTIQVATVNGSGSQSSNLILARSIFRMGIPVGPKNMFPSNIAGLPTWFTIRVSGEGYLANSGAVDYMVCLNIDTFAEDVKTIRKGGALTVLYPVYASTFIFGAVIAYFAYGTPVKTANVCGMLLLVAGMYLMGK